MKKLLSIVSLFLAAVTLSASVSCKGSPEDSSPQPSPPHGEIVEPIKLSYEDLYFNDETLSAPITGTAVYKASYGYTQKTEQGYNNFYYKYLKDGNYTDATLKEGRFVGEGAKFDGRVMTSAKSSYAVRAFVAPISGKAHVYGSPKPIEGNLSVKVYLDSTVLFDKALGAKEGVYHSNTVELNKGQTVYFVLEGEGSAEWNPTVDYVMAKETSLHHAADGYYGDVHPFYDEESRTMYMYYLSTGKQSSGYIPTFQSLLTTSRNMIQYNDVKIQLDESAPCEQDLYYVLNVIKDADGKYRSSFGFGNYAGTSVSDDLITWKRGSEPYIDPADDVLKYTYRAYFDQGVYSGRDPDIYYDKDSKQYYCIVMNYFSSAAASGKKSLALYKGDEKGIFSTKSTKVLDFTGKGDPECPQIKKIGDRWYVFYSESGTGTSGNVGRFAYRVGDIGVAPENVDWESKKEFYLDGGDVHAAQLCKIGDYYYMYGWISYRPHESVWGGYINLPREVFVREDGTLGARLDPELTKLLNKGLVASLSVSTATFDGFSESNGKFTSEKARSYASFDGMFGRSFLKTNVSLGGGDSVGVKISSGDTKYYVGVFKKNGKTYLSVTNDWTNPLSGVYQEIENLDITNKELKIVCDGRFIEAFIGDTYAVTAHTKLGTEYNLTAMAEGEGVSLNSFNIYRLADYYNIFD